MRILYIALCALLFAGCDIVEPIENDNLEAKPSIDIVFLSNVQSVQVQTLHKTAESVGQVTVILINGIWTSEEEAEVSRLALETLVAERSLDGLLDVIKFYNQSETAITARKKRFIAGGKVGDLKEALRQIASLIANSEGMEPDALRLAALVQQKLALGPVIIVGHSQGSLMAAQAIQALGEYDECSAVVSLGGPLGRDSFLPWPAESVDGIVIAGKKAYDPILVLGENDFPRLETASSRKADENVHKFELSAGPIFFSKVVEEHMKLHHFTGSYLADPESRQILGDILQKYTKSLLADQQCGNESEAEAVIYASSREEYPTRSSLWSVDAASDGDDRRIAAIRTQGGRDLTIHDLALSPSGDLWVVAFDTLYSVDKSSGVAIAEVAFPSYPQIGAMAFDHNGYLYVAGRLGQILSIDLATLEVPWYRNTRSGIQDMAFSFSGELYAVVADIFSSQLARIDLTSGQINEIGRIKSSLSGYNGLSFVGHKLYALTANQSYQKSYLLEVNTSTGKGEILRELAFSTSGAASKQ